MKRLDTSEMRQVLKDLIVDRDVLVLMECPANLDQWDGMKCFERIHVSQYIPAKSRYIKKDVQIWLRKKPERMFEHTLMFSQRYGEVVDLVIFEKDQTPDTGFSLFGVHLKSKWKDRKRKMTADTKTQEKRIAFSVNYIQSRIRSYERLRYGSNQYHVDRNRSLIVGDFNLLPHNAQMQTTKGFNAEPNRREVGNTKRTVAKNPSLLPHYYNPMWNWMGDGRGRTFEVPGTHFWSNPHVSQSRWQVLDAVLIGPGLLNLVDLDRVEVIKTLNMGAIPNKIGVVNTKRHSDHFPIRFVLTI